MLARACRQKEGRPPAKILAYRRAEGWKARRERRRLSFWKVPHTNRQKLKNWLMMVARAAPPVPMPKPKMKTGSSITLRAAPEKMPIMPNTALPWKRNWLLSTRAPIMKGEPMRI